MLDQGLIIQLKDIFASLEANYVFDITVSSAHEKRNELMELLNGVASCSDKITCRTREGSGLEFVLLKDGRDTRIKFRAAPNGHEFTSLLLAILNADGKGKNIPDEAICRRVKALKCPIHLTTYISLTCTNCPDVVQSLNLMALLNENIRHEMVDGAIYIEEVEAANVQGVPAVFADGKLLHSGRADFGGLLQKLEEHYGAEAAVTETTVRTYDVLVAGGGPAGVAAAIYTARKGFKVGILTDRFGGQVKDTVGIENLIGTPYTTGAQLTDDMKRHIQDYNIELFEHRNLDSIGEEDNLKVLHANSGEVFKAPAVIIAAGASWRRMNVPGEAEYIGRGVAFCPHCDGPFYKGKHVAVIGGGNSGIEAAIDLAGICSRVTVLEFMNELKADQVLQEKVKTLRNVEIFCSSQTTQVVGNSEKVTGLRILDRRTQEDRLIALDGVFVQIGLAPNSAVFKDFVTVNRFGEIEVDTHGRTSRKGVYAAGDVTNIPFKQIVISMGEGAKAALTAFEDRIRGVY